MHDGPERLEGTRLDRRLWWSTLLNTAITVAELVGGFLSGSLALVADALHNLSDVAALVLAIVARRLGRRPPSLRFTYGLKRLEVFAALINALALLVVSVLIAIEAVRRLRAPSAPDPGTMLVVALIALAGNAVSVFLLRGHAHDDLNVRSAFLHLAQDALASLVVVVAAVFARTEAGPYLDPLASVAICLVVLRSALSIVWDAVGMLVEGTPRGLDIEVLANEVATRFEPARLHHVHVWEVGPGQRVLTAHVLMPSMSLVDAESLCSGMRAYLGQEWQIIHATLEPEVNGCGHGNLLGAGFGAGACFPAGTGAHHEAQEPPA